MYRIWARRCLDEGVVAVSEGDPAGFVGARARCGEARVELVYVGEDAGGRGLGRALVRTALAAAACGRASVATQVGNVAALRLYESLGFRTRATRAILHLWLDELR
jgi:ribosomal protein S18 acetylase RimI-like enzyme